MTGESKKKILYIITKSVWAGAGKYTRDLAVSLPRNEFEPMVAAGGKGAMAEKLISAGIPYFEIKGFQRDVSFQKDIRAFFEILALLFKIKPDTVHVSSAKAGGIAGAAILAYKLFTSHFSLIACFTAHGWTFNEPRPRWQIIFQQNHMPFLQQNHLRFGIRLQYRAEKQNRPGAENGCHS